MKKIILTIIVALYALASQAQRTEKEVLRIDTLEIEYKTRFASSFKDNWFIQANFAERLLMGEEDTGMSLGKRLEPGFQVSVGKMFYPSIGARISGGGMRLTGWNSGIPGIYQGDSWLNPSFDPVKEYLESLGIDTSNGYKQELKYFDLYADLLIDMLNVFTKYKRFDRKFEWFVFPGMGWGHVVK